MFDKKRLDWFIYLRLVVVSLFLASTLVLNVHSPEILGDVSIPGLVKLILASFVFSLVSLVVARSTGSFNRILTYSQIVWDLLLVTILLLLTGGIKSPYSFLYFLSIINASILLARRESYYTASLCVILYGSILDLQYYGKLAPLGLSQAPAMQYGAGYIIYLIFLNSAAFYLTAILAGHLAERARVSESALQEKVIDYEELERLNSSIVSTIDSGLLTINTLGRIRVFNRYAEQLTGITQRSAYDRPLVEVIPGLFSYAEGFFSANQGEFEYITAQGKALILSFKSVPLTDRDGSRIGMILDFHDLTQIKQMEAQLKKADRLAAIGELSARIAHEIRNPLASISGSVQLIAQGERVDERDSRLISIVLRETDRLNTLIRDFLAYARPNVPNKISVTLGAIVDELCAISGVDPRFEKVSVQNRIPMDIQVLFDLDQCKQVFWNLLLNAAESMSQQGEIILDAVMIRNETRTGIVGGDVVKITVKDNGSGVLPENMRMIFEPFFTTKPGGTGLGLATVYRIVESHGGVILVDSMVGVETVFTIYLPV